MATSGEIQRSIQRFQEFASDLIRSDMDTFGDRLAVFMNFCRTDSFFSDIVKQMEALVGDNFNGWLSERRQTLGSFAGSGDLIFPVDLEVRTAFQFEILRRIDTGNMDFLDFTHTFFSVGSHISDHIRALNEAITKPMSRELKHRLEEVLEQLPEDKRAQVAPMIYQVFHNVRSVVQQHASGSNINQYTTIGDDSELHRAFSELRKQIGAIEGNAETIRLYLESIEAAEALAREEKPKVHAVRTLLGSLPAIGAVATLIDTILKLIS